MLIPIVYQDGRYDLVKPNLLDQMLENSAISRFRRSDGWVDVATGPLRRGRRMYCLPERRSEALTDTALS